MEAREQDKEATRLYGQRQFAESLALVEKLVAANYPPSFLLMGFIHEFRDDAPIDLGLARQSYMQALNRLGDARIDTHLCRVSLKLGDRLRAEKYLHSALSNRIFPDALILAGDFHSRKLDLDKIDPSRQDLVKAAHYYFRGAIRGRLVALKEYAQIQLALGRRFSFLLAAFAILTLSPFYKLLFGRRTNWKH
jgi:hypothetical protein